ncbi:MAG: flavodoxin family protein [Desulfobacterales bacterium]|nr:flavodoxin family protein [Desulfobacterales bacterium]
MKIITLIGSPHGLKGNTAKLTQIVLEGAESEGATSEIISLTGKNILPCKGCDMCHKKGICPQDDEFESIKKKIIEADCLILASPNYIFSVSAQMKAFMDRCCGVLHCLGFEGKYGASIVTSGGGDEEPIADYMNHFLIITGVRPVGSVWAAMGNIGEIFPDEIRTNALNLGKKLVLSCKNKITCEETETRINKFKDRMRYLMQWKKQEWTFEYEYWKKHHNLE